MGLVAQHGWCSGKDVFRDQILTDNGNHHTSRAYVLLGTAEEQTVFFHVNRF